MSTGWLTLESINLVAFMQVAVMLVSGAFILCMRKAASKRSPATRRRKQDGPQTESTFSEGAFRQLGLESPPQQKEGKKQNRAENPRTDKTQTLELPTCPRSRAKTAGTKTSDTTDATSFTKSTATKSAYQPPPAPPRDQEKDRQRAQQAFAAFCQRDKKPSEVEDEDPTSSTLPAQSEEQQATVQKEKKPVDQPKPES